MGRSNYFPLYFTVILGLEMFGPASGTMQNPKDLNGVLDYSVWQYEWRVGDDQLTGAMNAAGATCIRLIGQ